MENMNDIVKLAIDTYHGKVNKYSIDESLEVLRQAAIELNGGSTVLDYRAMRDGKCNGLFSLLETILTKTTYDGFTGNEYFNALVDTRNVAEGDKPVFEVEDSTVITVSEASEGNLGIRRQRLSGVQMVTIPTSYKFVRIYEEMTRILAGRSDFNTMIDKTSKAFAQKLYEDTYKVWNDATSNDFGGSAFYNAGGSYSEATLLSIIEHVEAAAGGKPATIIGTAGAIRNLQSSIIADSAKEDLYNLGYYGKFYGTPVVKLNQIHKQGTTTFAFDDKTLHIIAGDEKPIKLVYEGDGLILAKDPTENADLTQEYYLGEKYGIGLVMTGDNTGIGRYSIQ